jgi:hypothetical protein
VIGTLWRVFTFASSQEHNNTQYSTKITDIPAMAMAIILTLNDVQPFMGRKLKDVVVVVVVLLVLLVSLLEVVVDVVKATVVLEAAWDVVVL